MKLSYIIIFPFLIVLNGCDNAVDFDKGPCKFAPPESNFPVIPGTFCEECFFNFNFQGKQYSFLGDKIESSYVGDYSKMWNVFFEFYLYPPDSDEELYSSIGVKTPLMKRKVVINGIGLPPLVSTAFGIYNYCNDFFEPITDDISQSYHRLTKAELIESYPVEINFQPYQSYFFYLLGELQISIIINGETKVITAKYKVRSVVYEKL